MKHYFTYILIFSLISTISFAQSLYDFETKDAKNNILSTNTLKGKAVLIVNIATKCGYTGQLDGLESLYKKYQSKNFMIIGIPSNDFGGQTPESNKKVAEFCRLKYGVSFPITQKMGVKENQTPLVKFIVNQSGGKSVKWNFEKFLFDKNGKFIARFPSQTEPNDKELLKKINNLL